MAVPYARQTLAIDLQQFRKERILRTRAPASQLLADIQVLRNPEAATGRELARTGPLLPRLLMALFAFLRRLIQAPLRLEARRYELVAHLLKLLRVDITPTEPLALELDLRPDTHPAKLQRETQTRTSWKVKHYVDPWLSLQGRLLDGSHFRVELTERVDDRTRWKTTARGKQKRKTKQVSDAIAKVQLRVKPERYQHLDRLGPHARNAVQLPPGTQLKNLGVEGDRITLAVRVNAPWDFKDTERGRVNAVRLVAMMFLSLYQVLNLSRRLDKKALPPSVG